MPTRTGRFRLQQLLFIFFALNIGLAGVCAADETGDFDLRPDALKKKPGWAEKGDELIDKYIRGKKDENEIPTGPGYDSPGNPSVEPSDETLMSEQEGQRRRFIDQINQTRQHLRTGANVHTEMCYRRLTAGWDGSSTPDECKTAIDERNKCAKERKDLEDRQTMRGHEWNNKGIPWRPVAIFTCAEVYDGLPHPYDLLEKARARKGTNPAANKNTANDSPQQQPKTAPQVAPTNKGPSQAEVMDYVQRAAQDCLRRFPGGSPGALTPQQAACVQEKTDAYKNGAR